MTVAPWLTRDFGHRVDPAPSRRRGSARPVRPVEVGRAARRSLGILIVLTLGAGTARKDGASAADGLDSLTATRDRPLFSSTRRPAQPARTDAPPVIVKDTAQPSTPNLQLQGIVYGDYRRVAIVRRLADARSIEVSIGSRIDGWVVSDIQPRRIALNRNGTSLVLELPGPKR